MYDNTLICDIHQAERNETIPNGFRGYLVDSGCHLEHGAEIKRKYEGQNLCVYQEHVRAQLDDIEVICLQKSGLEQGQYAWCDITFTISDPEIAAREMGDQSPLRRDDLLTLLKPLVEGALNQISSELDLTTSPGRATAAQRIGDDLNLPFGLAVQNFQIRKVRTHEDLLLETRLKEELETGLRKIANEGVLARLSSDRELEQALAGIETEETRRCLLTDEESRQGAKERLTAYMEMLSRGWADFAKETAGLHADSYSLHREILGVQKQMADLMGQIITKPERKSVDSASVPKHYRDRTQTEKTFEQSDFFGEITFSAGRIVEYTWLRTSGCGMRNIPFSTERKFVKNAGALDKFDLARVSRIDIHEEWCGWDLPGGKTVPDHARPNKWIYRAKVTFCDGDVWDDVYIYGPAWLWRNSKREGMLEGAGSITINVDQAAANTTIKS